ncbi:amino acid aldolase [Microvirga sp. VF16]|uniref:amino acid aldolase n=1 Tax=Microvirga sp. VF16 TaxID=2807101 RepID=UPI00193E2A17|nr:amino acid aldolase [Microvirga sp. VF16]QRM33145.1 amino acid aldolase [Microvirga sp. VF16]
MSISLSSQPYDSSVMAHTLEQLGQESPGILCKGIPASFAGKFADVGQAGFFLGDRRLPLPVALLRETAMMRNRTWMAEYLKSAGVDLAPHGKTSLAPELFRMQMEDGVWGLTAATAQQLALFAAIGIRRVILANQLVGDGNIAIALDCAATHPDLNFYTLVDSHENVTALISAWVHRSDIAPLKLLIEVGVTGGRTGVRDVKRALDLARHISQADGVLLAGIEGYEGIVPGADQAAREAAVSAMMQSILELAQVSDSEGLWGCDEILLTAGGTEFFDLCSRGLMGFAGSRPHRVVIRSGCYITHDSIAYDRAFRRICERSPEAAALAVSRPEAALEVWAAVQSMPEPGLAFATLGKRDISHDWDMPLPLRWLRPGQMLVPQPLPPGHRVLRLNDQHAYLEVPVGSPLAVGDMVGFGVSHVCTTFDKWRCLLTVDDNYRVTGAIRTFF